MSATHDQDHNHGSIFKRIIQPFIILTILTALEFTIAFTLEGPAYENFRLWTYITLTLMKAFYIVAYFMHLKHERVNLIYTITVPSLLLIYLIVLLLLEAYRTDGGVSY